MTALAGELFLYRYRSMKSLCCKNQSEDCMPEYFVIGSLIFFVSALLQGLTGHGFGSTA